MAALISCVVLLASCAFPTFAAKAVLSPLLKRHAQQDMSLAAKAAPSLRATMEQSTSEDMAPTEPPSIPQAADVGSNGFPTLPAVAEMQGGAFQKSKTITSQAKVLEARIVQVQMQNQAKMARQKAVFEQKLKMQEEGNREVITQNQQIKGDIHTLKTTNEALRKHSRELQESNRLMRNELRTLTTKLTLAQNFVSESMSKTDDSKAKELAVLQKKHQIHHRVEEDDEDDTSGGSNEAGASTGEDAEDDADEQDDSDTKTDKDDDEDDNAADDGTSLLALKVTRSLDVDDGESDDKDDEQPDTQSPQLSLFNPPPVSNPKGLLDVLSKGVSTMEQEEKESEKKLRSMFIADFTVGNKRHEAVLAQQKALNATRYTLLGLRTELRRAESHLQETEGHLEQRLRGFGLFVQRLAHLALAPAAEAPRLLQALPVGVTIPSPAKKAN